MATDAPNKLMTTADLEAIRPNKKWDYWLFQGELRKKRVTKRNPWHCFTTANLSHLLRAWLLQQPKPRGRVCDGEVYFRIRTNPDTNVGIDVALASAEQVARLTDRSSYIDGPPILAVEVLSPHDRQRDTDEAVTEYLACGGKVLWVINPVFQTVAVHRPGHPPVLVNVAQVLDGNPDLPGFSVPVAEIFAD